MALATCEAEYMPLAATTQESMYLVQLLKGMDGSNHDVPVKIYEDNQGAISLSKKPSMQTEKQTRGYKVSICTVYTGRRENIYRILSYCKHGS